MSEHPQTTGAVARGTQIRATDTCRYCGHARSRHNRPEPANPQPGGSRCAAGCVCAFFKEHDGSPMYAALAKAKGGSDG